MNDMMEGLTIVLIYLAPLFLALAIGGIISDYVLPRCPRLLGFLERVLGIDLGP